MLKLAKKYYEIHRSITGSGLRKSLKLLQSIIPKLQIKKIKSGTKVFDWKIPPEWNVKDAFIQNEKSQKIIDFKKNNLHLINYSTPINKIVKREDLTKHLHYLKKKPNAIPYITSYYKKYWGFCLSYNQFKKKIKGNNFKVLIKSKFNKNGNLNYGELIIKGKSKKEILIHTYICHPRMANNETSGPILCTYLANFFSKRKNRFSFRFIFTPETIGTISYINKNLEQLKKNVIGGYVITCAGDENIFSYLNTKYPSISNRVAMDVFYKNKIKFKNYSFLQRGSDERQYNSPGVNLPIGSIMRSKYGTYKEYHTSKDDFKFVTNKGLNKSFNVIKKILINFDNQIIPISTVSCEPFLTKKKIYPTLSTGKTPYKVDKILDFLTFSDGSNTLEDISKKINLKNSEILQIYKLLIKKKLILNL